MDFIKISSLSFALFLCSSCAFDLARINYEPAELISNQPSDDSFTLTEDIQIDRSPCNYDRTLRAGTQWSPVKVLVQGVVYDSLDQMLTIECSNIYEVYLVVNDAELVGIYLPVEHGYVALKRTYPLKKK